MSTMITSLGAEAPIFQTAAQASMLKVDVLLDHRRNIEIGTQLPRQQFSTPLDSERNGCTDRCR